MASLSDFVTLETKQSKTFDSVFDIEKLRSTARNKNIPAPLSKTSKLEKQLNNIEDIFTSALLSAARKSLAAQIKANYKKLLSNPKSVKFGFAPIINPLLYSLWNNGWSLGIQHATKELGSSRALFSSVSDPDAVNNIIEFARKREDIEKEYQELQAAIQANETIRRRANEYKQDLQNRQDDALTQLRELTVGVDSRRQLTPEAKQRFDELEDVVRATGVDMRDIDSRIKAYEKDLTKLNKRFTTVDTQLEKLQMKQGTVSAKETRETAEEVQEVVGGTAKLTDSQRGLLRERFIQNKLLSTQQKQIAPSTRTTAKGRKAEEKAINKQTAAKDILESKLQQELYSARIQKNESINLTNTQYDQIYLRDRTSELSANMSTRLDNIYKNAVIEYLAKVQNKSGPVSSETQLIEALTGEKTSKNRVRYINELLQNNNVPSKKTKGGGVDNTEEMEEVSTANQALTERLSELVDVQDAVDFLNETKAERSLSAAEQRQLSGYLEDLRRKPILEKELSDNQRRLQQLQAQATSSDSPFQSRLNDEITLTDTDRNVLGISANRKTITVGELDQMRTNAIRNGETNQQAIYAAQRLARTELSLAYNMGRIDKMRTAGVECVRWRAALEKNTCDYCAQADGSIHRLDIVLLENPEFRSNNSAIPAHPNCQCYWEPSKCDDSTIITGVIVPPKGRARSVWKFVTNNGGAGGASILLAYIALRTFRGVSALGRGGLAREVNKYLGGTASVLQPEASQVPIPQQALPELSAIRPVLATPLIIRAVETETVPIELRPQVLQESINADQQRIAEQARNEFIEEADRFFRTRLYKGNTTYGQAVNQLVDNSSAAANLQNYARLETLANTVNTSYQDLETRLTGLISRIANEGLTDELYKQGTVLSTEASLLSSRIENAIKQAADGRSAAMSEITDIQPMIRNLEKEVSLLGFSNPDLHDRYLRYRAVETPLIEISDQVPQIDLLNTTGRLNLNYIRQYDNSAPAYISNLSSYDQLIRDIAYESSYRIGTIEDLANARIQGIESYLVSLARSRVVTNTTFTNIAKYRKTLTELQQQLDSITYLRKLSGTTDEVYSDEYFRKSLQTVNAFIRRVKDRFTQDPRLLMSETSQLMSYLEDSPQLTKKLGELRAGRVNDALTIYNEVMRLEDNLNSFIRNLDVKPKLRTVDRVLREEGIQVTKAEWKSLVNSELETLQKIPSTRRTAEQIARIDELQLEQIRIQRAEFMVFKDNDLANFARTKGARDKKKRKGKINWQGAAKIAAGLGVAGGLYAGSKTRLGKGLLRTAKKKFRIAAAQGKYSSNPSKLRELDKSLNDINEAFKTGRTTDAYNMWKTKLDDGDRALIDYSDKITRSKASSTGGVLSGPSQDQLLLARKTRRKVLLNEYRKEKGLDVAVNKYKAARQHSRRGDLVGRDETAKRIIGKKRAELDEQLKKAGTRTMKFSSSTKPIMFLGL